MNVFKDTLDFADATKKGIDKFRKNKSVQVKKDLRSISSFAAKSIYYFPILCSKGVHPDTAGLMAKGLEIAYISFVRACFAMMPELVVEQGENVNMEEYLRRFHQNIGIDSSSGFGLKLECTNPYDEYQMFPNDILNEAAPTRKYGEEKKVLKVIESERNKLGTRHDDGLAQRSMRPNDTLKTYRDVDYKKYSHMGPSYVPLELQVRQKVKEGVSAAYRVEIPVGIKTQLHPLDPTQLMEQIMDTVGGKGLLHGLIRWSTGEMVSLRDLIFGISNLKKNVATRNTDVRRWFDALDRRKRLSSVSDPVLSKKLFLPNASVVVTNDEVEEIRREIGFSLLDARHAIKFMRENFLLSFCVIDDITETAFVLYDGHRNFEELPYSTIQRENMRQEQLSKAVMERLTKIT